MAKQLEPEDYEKLFAKRPYAHVATVGPDGVPQSTPVWVQFHEGKVRFSTVEGRVKHRNLTGNPVVALSAIDPDDPYSYVQIRGAAVLTPDPEGKLIQQLSRDYKGVPYTADPPGTPRVIVTIDPKR